MSGKKAVIFGASGGIGAAITTQLRLSGDFATVSTGTRSKGGDFRFDLTDESSIAAAASAIAETGPVDLVIVATGVLHTENGHGPEKSWRMIDPARMAHVFAHNTIGPALIAKHVLPLMHRDRRAVFAALSARVGSIGDNRLGGWHSYRASKAALNMLIRTFAIELAHRNPEAISVALHPGTVETSLSAPFQGNVPSERLFSPRICAEALLSVVDGLTPKDSGGFFAWDGQPIPF